MNRRFFVVLILLFAMVSDSAAQKLTQRQRRERMDSVLAARYYKIPYDTNYVVRPQGRLTLKVRMKSMRRVQSTAFTRKPTSVPVTRQHSPWLPSTVGLA